MIRYLGIFGLLLATLAVGLLPTTAPERPERFQPRAATYTPVPIESLTLNGLQSRLTSERSALRMRLANVSARESMLGPTLEAHAASGELWVGATPGADPRDVALLRESYRMLRPSGDVAVGVARLPWPEATGFTSVDQTTTWMYGEEAGQPWCLTVRNYNPRALNPSNQWPSIGEEANPARAVDELGACAFVARFGLPGVRVDEWFRTSGFTLAERGNRGTPDLTQNAGPLSDNFTMSVDYMLPLRSCLGGWDSSCAELFFPDPHPVNRYVWGRATADLGSVVIESGNFSNNVFNSVFGETALARLADQHPDAFGEFWRSDAPVEEAFASAFGMSPAEWLRSGFVDVSTAEFGPAPSGVEWAVALAWASLLALIGILREIKRRVS